MKVLLIQPNHRKGGEDKGVWGITAPMGLCYIAAVLEQNKINVEILDANALNISAKEVISEVIKRNPKIIGVSMLTPDHNYCVEIAKGLDQEYIKVAGGPHATAVPDELLNNGFDIVVRGEGEYTMLDLASEKDLTDVYGISYKSDGRIFRNPDRKTVDPNSLPLPSRHLLLAAGVDMPYFSTATRYKPWAEVLTSRGCPYDCYYCNKNTLGYKYRPRTPENVVGEIEYLAKDFNVKEFNILDDTFNFDIARAEKICDLIIEKKLNIYLRFSNGIRADKITESLLKKMKEAGCYYLAYGIESGSQEVLDKIPKNLKLEEIREAVRLAKKFNIEVTGFFMFGLIGDTPETMKNTIDFAKELNVDIASFSICTPYPGTRLWNMIQKEGKILSKDYGELFHTIGKARYIHPLAPSPEEIEKAYINAHREFYFRPKYIVKKALSIHSLSQIKTMMRGFSAILRISSKQDNNKRMVNR